MILKCKMCGGDLVLEGEKTIIECEYCGTRQTVPSADNEKKTNLFNRANRLRMSAEFDKAASVYESIVAEFPEEAEAYWGLCLCAYGIEYVDDPATGKKIPTCHRTRAESIMESSNFDMACEYADVIAKRLYRSEAREIDRLQKDILSIVANESPYDVFICYKETAEDGGRTEDSVIAQDIYDALTAKGLKVFFARITLEDKLGQQYEPYIYAALHSAKVMLAIGTCFEHFDAVWVKNEWSRFLDMMKEDRTKVLVPCFKGVDAYDIPKEMRSLQAQDMGKLGFMQDLVRGVEKIVGKMPATQSVMQPVQQTVVQQQSVGVDSLLRRAQLFLEDGDWKSANEYLNKVLDINPEYAPAYFGKVMAKYQIRKEAQFAESDSVRDGQFESDADWKKAIRFADDAQKKIYEGYLEGVQRRRAELAEKKRIKQIIDSAETNLVAAKTVERCIKIKKSLEVINRDPRARWLMNECDKRIEQINSEAYDSALEQMRNAAEFLDFDGIRKKFWALGNYRDSVKLAHECAERSEALRDTAYEQAIQTLNTASSLEDCKKALQQFEKMLDYRDSVQMIEACQEKAVQFEAKLAEERKREAARLEQQKMIDERNRQIAAAKAKKRKILITICSMMAAAAVAAYVFVLRPILDAKKLEAAIEEENYVLVYQLLHEQHGSDSIGETMPLEDGRLISEQERQGKNGFIHIGILLDQNGRILDVTPYKHQETAGLGAAVLDNREIFDALVGQEIETAEIDTKGGATISSIAVNDILKSVAKSSMQLQTGSATSDHEVKYSSNTYDVRGFQPMKVEVSLDADGRIVSVNVPEHNETPGFGVDLINAGFDELIGQNIATAQIDGKSGVTLTTNAINQALRDAAKANGFDVPESEIKEQPASEMQNLSVIGMGKTNRDANIRIAPNAKVVTQVREGIKLSILDCEMDKEGHTWYKVSTASGTTTGYVRDYVLDVEEYTDAQNSVTTSAREVKYSHTYDVQGFQSMKVEVNVDADGRIVSVNVPEHNETPGFGVDLINAGFDELIGQNIATAQIDGKSGVTLTTNAINQALRDAAKANGFDVKETDDQITREMQNSGVIGMGTTNRSIKIRENPRAEAKVLKQAAKGTKLNLLNKETAPDGKIWYKVSSETDGYIGYVRDYVLDVEEYTDAQNGVTTSAREVKYSHTYDVQGFQLMKVEVNLDADGRIVSVNVPEHHETPGFGADLISAGFDALVGQNIANAQIDVKSGVTMTSNGINDALKQAAQDYHKQ